MLTTGIAVRASRTSSSGSGRAALQVGGDLALRERRHESGSPHKAREVSLERILIGVAGIRGLASGLDHDVGCVVEGVEVLGGSIQESLSALMPEVRAIGVIVEHGSSVQVDSSVVGPDDIAVHRAVRSILRAIVYVIVGIYESDIDRPVVGLQSPVEIGLVPCESSKAGGELEEGAIGDGVFIIVAFVGREDLPFQPSTARRRVPTIHLGIPEILGELDPGVWAGRRGVVLFCSRHGSKAPERLIIVPFVKLLIGHHEVREWANLRVEGL